MQTGLICFNPQKQIEDLQNLSRQYEQQAAERMVVSQGQPEEDAFINRPIRVQQQRRYPPNHYRPGKSLGLGCDIPLAEKVGIRQIDWLVNRRLWQHKGHI
ncbi:MAG: hypothetical protein Q9200_003274 [Gallowayella weberi]